MSIDFQIGLKAHKLPRILLRSLRRKNPPQVKRLKKTFTLIEILVVVSIISILASMIIPAIQRAMILARRAESSHNIKQLVTTLIASGNVTNSTKFSPEFLLSGGIMTTTSGSVGGDVVLDGQTVVNNSPAYKVFTKYAGKHPFDSYSGQYVFFGVDDKGRPKSKYSDEDRVVMELYNWDEEGDGKVAVGFADGHVVELQVTTAPSAINLIEVMSTKGENGGNL